jgi:hypothetical protein
MKVLGMIDFIIELLVDLFTLGKLSFRLGVIILNAIYKN